MRPISARGLSPSRQLGTVGAMLLATVLAAAHPAAAITYIVPSDGSMVDRTGTIVFGRVLSAAASQWRAASCWSANRRSGTT